MLRDVGTVAGEAGEGQAGRPAPTEDGALSLALAPIVSELGSSEGSRAPLVAAFARAVLRRVPATELEEVDPAGTAAAVVDAFRFVDRRPPGQISVRLIDPTVALDGSHPSGTIMEVSCEDRQFIVTTVKEELHRLGSRAVRVLHPVFGAERGPGGRLAAILPARTAATRESFLQVELGGQVAPDARPRLVRAITRVLGDVFAATDDHAAMRDELARVVAGTRAHAGKRYPADEVAEAADLLEWLLDANFVLLGCCHLRWPDTAEAAPAQVVDGLGILARPEAALGRAERAPDAQLLHIGRTAEVSTVHHQVPMHGVDVVEVSPEGDVTGVFRVVGLFSYKAHAEPAVVTPVLRFKLRRVLELEDVVEGSHDETTLISLFQVLPKEELFETDVASLRQMLGDLLVAEEQHDVRARLRVDRATHTVSALLSIPQEQYTPTLRHRLERFLMAQLDGSRVDVQVSLGDQPDALVRLVVVVDGPLPEEPLDSLEREIRLLCRTWEQELAACLASRLGEGRGGQLAVAWAESFPASYRDSVSPAQAVDDVLQLDGLLRAGDGEAGTGGISIVLRADGGGAAQARLKVFKARTAVDLSAFLPILESLGLWVVEERPYALGAPGNGVHLHDFGVRDATGAALDVGRDGPRLAEAAEALWHGRADTDSLNRLVLRSQLSWDDVAVLRAYRRYRSQVGMAFTTGYVDDVLVENASIARAVLELFAVRFDPAQEARPDAEAALRRGIVEACDAVPRLDHDRILRGFLGLVDATVRTNRYLPGHSSHLSLKFESAAVPDVPRPVPHREIFVHGPSVEGIHLRWGPVARGGIRWSERPDDYRSEVLGLMRAQVLKNALIVPTGAKGGFVVKPARYGAEPVIDGCRAYEIFITSLLDLTDNVSGQQVVPVPRRRDGDDPYLVVAADRGTAGFSDLANRLSEERRFWLGDAFASGGSRGYDHKRLGITARGAWVAVRHHFAELGIDVDSESMSVVGIGDLSGDVFGNFMTRSDRIRLVAAFDHRDIFLDPDPDPLASHRERARLAAMASSSWQDYDRALISAGGGVWSRLDKRIDLSPEVRTALGVEAEHLTPAELIGAILQAPAALLFAGGIGTFVRASTEPDQDIDDRSNSDVRVEGSRIRARVVGEGANLAFTQRARIEYARRGGRINTDAIDNSAGVDTSDREVNLKILLRPAVEADELTMEARDQLLSELCDDVVAAVLDDSLQQSLALSRAQAASAGLMDAVEALIAELESTTVLDRSIEALPTTEEMRARAQAGAGLTRPELAVLLAGSKRSLAAQLLASRVPDEQALRAVLVDYFPARPTERFPHLLDGHRLRRELIASMMANDVVNRMGATFVSRLAAETGGRPATVASAYWVARGVSDAPRCWRDLDGKADFRLGQAVTEVAASFSSLLEALTRDYLRRGEGADIAASVGRDRPPFAELESVIAQIGTPERRRRRARRAEALVDSGVDPSSAVGWACLSELEIGPDVAELVRETGRPVTGVAEALLLLGESLGIDRLGDVLKRTAVADRWSRAAWQGLVDDLDDLRRLAARLALEIHPLRDESEAVSQFLTTRGRRVAEAAALIREIESQPQPRLDAVAVATRAVRRALY